MAVLLLRTRRMHGDPRERTISTFWRASCCDHGISVYKYINGRVTLIEEIEWAEDLDHPGMQITTLKRRVRGKMKLIKRTVARVEDEDAAGSK